jgi:hypothetical protein
MDSLEKYCEVESWSVNTAYPAVYQVSYFLQGIRLLQAPAPQRN